LYRGRGGKELKKPGIPNGKSRLYFLNEKIFTII